MSADNGAVLEWEEVKDSHGFTTVFRAEVPSGWIYRFSQAVWIPGHEHPEWIANHVFVPFSSEGLS